MSHLPIYESLSSRVGPRGKVEGDEFRLLVGKNFVTIQTVQEAKGMQGQVLGRTVDGNGMKWKITDKAV